MNPTTKNWKEMNDEEREEWIEHVREIWEGLREEVVAVLGADATGAQWTEYERADLYQAAVTSRLGRVEERRIEESADSDEDESERFSRHCASSYRRGVTDAACAREWRCGGGR